MKTKVLMVVIVLLVASLLSVAPAHAARPSPPPPELYHFSTWTTGSIGVGVTVARGGDAAFNFAVVHEPNVPVQCYLVVYTVKGRVTTTWANVGMGTYTTSNDGLNLLAPLPSWFTWKGVVLPPGTYRWRVEAWDAQAGEWAHISSTATLTVTR
jgi:hypothetical protein